MRERNFRNIVAVVLGLSSVASVARAQLQGEPVPAAKAGAKAAPGELPPIEGQLSRKYKIDDRNPEASVPDLADANKNPLEIGYLLQDLLVKAEAAQKQKDFGGMIRYYRAVAKAVPNRAKAWGKLCEAYQLANDRDEALNACRFAIQREGAEMQDFTRLIGLSVQQPGELPAEQRAELGRVLAHLAQAGADDVTLEHLRCQVAVKTSDVPLLETCTKGLAKLAPDDPKTIVFQWNLAMQRGAGLEAARLLERAKDYGVPQDNVALMAEVTAKLTGGGRPNQALVWMAIMFTSATLVGGVVWLRKRRLFAQQPAP